MMGAAGRFAFTLYLGSGSQALVLFCHLLLEFLGRNLEGEQRQKTLSSLCKGSEVVLCCLAHHRSERAELMFVQI
jgi:hypothetical protein